MINLETMKHAKPTIFWGAPRIWEKLEMKLKEISSQSSVIVQKIPSWDKEAYPAQRSASERDASSKLGFLSANYTNSISMKRELGLEESKILMVTSAPMKTATLEYFKSIDLPIMNVYGMSECNGPETTAKP